jgi:hypothetical protein
VGCGRRTVSCATALPGRVAVDLTCSHRGFSGVVEIPRSGATSQECQDFHSRAAGRVVYWLLHNRCQIIERTYAMRASNIRFFSSRLFQEPTTDSNNFASHFSPFILRASVTAVSNSYLIAT